MSVRDPYNPDHIPAGNMVRCAGFPRCLHCVCRVGKRKYATARRLASESDADPNADQMTRCRSCKTLTEVTYHKLVDQRAVA